MVLVDLIVADKNGKPIPDVKQDDITLLEDGKPEKIALFSSYSEARKNADVTPAPLPPDVYSNDPKYRQPPGPLVLLLLDGLNTGTADQVYSRQQMLRYLRTQLQPDQRVAVLALAQDLLLLQDFTDDSRLLINTLEKYSPKKSMMVSRGEPFTLTQQAADALPKPSFLLMALDRFNQERAIDSIDARVSLTLAALASIARAMAGYPGRKNLIWVSSAFPFSLSPQDTGYGHMYRNYSEQIQQTARLLSAARVAVYSVDARGLVGTQPRPDALVSTVARPEQAGEDEMTQSATMVDTSHLAMEQLAQATGGRAFYNVNDLSKAVASGVSDGTSYYTLGYYPENKDWDGKFRRIEIKTKRKGIRIRFREGYYALNSADAAPGPNPKQQQNQMREVLAAALDPMPATAVTFRARLVTAPTGQSPQQVQFQVDADSISFEDAGQGRQRCNLDFVAFSVAADGKILRSVAKSVDTPLQTSEYASVLQQGLPFRMEIESSAGTQYLRLAVRDNLSGRVGTLEIPNPNSGSLR